MFARWWTAWQPTATPPTRCRPTQRPPPTCSPPPTPPPPCYPPPRGSAIASRSKTCTLHLNWKPKTSLSSLHWKSRSCPWTGQQHLDCPLACPIASPTTQSRVSTAHSPTPSSPSIKHPFFSSITRKLSFNYFLFSFSLLQEPDALCSSSLVSIWRKSI